jgi:tetratricopeptide (TPR) repeat protein
VNAFSPYFIEKKSTMRPIFLVFAFLAFALGCKPTQEPPAPHLGMLDFQVTGNPDAQPAFTEGLLLLHSFEYADARETFAEARAKDSTMSMAYWGEAMTWNHPLWQEQDFDKGLEVLNALAPTPEERVVWAATEIEKDFIQGINILYGPGDKASRDSLYAAYMGTLYAKYPGNDEVASFYSLALNGWGTTEKNLAIMEKAAGIGLEVLGRNPNHPGALHYVVHAYDHPEFAAQALEIADKYAKVAPDAGHALHMPTHTYVALGLWDRVIESNIASWKAERARKARKQLDNKALGYHAWHWLQYGYLQKGDTATARAMVDSMQAFCETLPDPRARAHLVYLKTTYLAESDNYTSAVTPLPIDLGGLNISTQAKDHFVRGMALYARADKRALDSLIKTMADQRVIEELKTPEKGIRMCGNISRNIATRTDLQVAEAMECQLRAMRAMLDGDAKKAEEFLKKSIDLEDACGYAFGPPEIVKPAHEFYGEWLLEQGRPQDAAEQFDLALKLAPNRRHSMAGKERAAKAL